MAANAVVPHGTGPYYKTFMEASQTDNTTLLTAPGAPPPAPRPVTAAPLMGDALVKQMDSIRMHDLELPDPSDTHTHREIPRSLSEMIVPNSRSNHDLNQAYITSVKAGDTMEVARFLREGVEIDARDANCPALHWAIFMGRVNTVLLLIRSGARRNIEDSDQQTAVHICLHPRHGMLNQMKKEHVGSTLAKKYEADAVEVLTALLQGGWSPDCQDALGRTGLHHVAEQGNCRLAQVLLQFSANPRMLNKAGYSPTDVATLKAKSEGLTKYVQLCDMLRQASFQSQSPQNMSPMGIPDELEADSAASVKQGRYQAESRNGGGGVRRATRTDPHARAQDTATDGATTPTNMGDDAEKNAVGHQHHQQRGTYGRSVRPGTGVGGAALLHHDAFRESRDRDSYGSSDDTSTPVYANRAGGDGGTMLNDDGAFAEVEAVFRPLMAALCSFSGNWETYTSHGVEKSVLATRLHQVVGGATMQVDAYIQAAVERGLITVHRGGRQHRQQFIAVAAKFSFYLARPIQSYSSTNLYGGSNTNINRSSSANHMGISGGMSGGTMGGMPSARRPPPPAFMRASPSRGPAGGGGEDAGEPEEPGLIESDFSDDDDGDAAGGMLSGDGDPGSGGVAMYQGGSTFGGLAAASVPAFPSVYHHEPTAGPTTLFSEHDWGSALSGALDGMDGGGAHDNTDSLSAEGEHTLDYEALVGEVIRDVSPDIFPTGRRGGAPGDRMIPPDTLDPDRAGVLDEMRTSFLYDPFASNLGPEPLFPQHNPTASTVPRSNTVSNVGAVTGAWLRDLPARPPPGIPVPHSMASALGGAAWPHQDGGHVGARATGPYRTDSAPVFPSPPARGPTTPAAATMELGWAAGVSAAGENDSLRRADARRGSNASLGEGWGRGEQHLAWAADTTMPPPLSLSGGSSPARKGPLGRS